MCQRTALLSPLTSERALAHSVFFFNDTATTEIYTLSLHDALPISRARSRIAVRSARARSRIAVRRGRRAPRERSEEHKSELQSPCNLVCRLLLEKKKKRTQSDVRIGCREHIRQYPSRTSVRALCPD